MTRSEVNGKVWVQTAKGAVLPIATLLLVMFMIVPVPSFVLNEIAPLCADKNPDDLVFPGPEGNYLPRPKSIRGWFSGAVSRANVQRITPHDLRHTAASLAISAGVNVLALQRMLGHKDPMTTLRVYSHMLPDDFDNLAAAMDKATTVA